MSSGALVWRQTAKSADSEHSRKGKRVRHVARPEQNESLGTRRLTSGSLESNELDLHAYLKRQEGMNM